MADAKKKEAKTVTKKANLKKPEKKVEEKMIEDKTKVKSITKKESTTKVKKAPALKSSTQEKAKKSTKKATVKKTSVPKVTSKVKKTEKENKTTDKVVSIPTKLPKKTKEKSAEKSRKANSKTVTARKRKREATRIIPVDKILEAQRKLEEKEQKDLGIDVIDDNKKKKNVKKVSKTKKNSKKFKINFSFFSKLFEKVKSIFDFSSFSPKTRKILKCVVFACIGLIIVEGIYLLVLKNTILRGTYYDVLNSVCLDGTDMVAVGSSDFKHSKENKHIDKTKAKIVKYDKNGTILFEKMYNDGINSTFNSVISVEDGYVAVGSYEKNNEQTKEDLKDAIIVKYDKEGKELWSQTFSSLSNTKFNKVISVEDGYVVIGQSIYANMEMGNSTEGGGVILKYSKDGELLWKSFHGGTKSASFNGIVEVNGWLYVVGRDGTDFGNIVQFNSNGAYQWHKNYRYTDTLGLSDIVYKNDRLYAVGSKEIFDTDVTDDSDRNTTNTDALLICFGLDGEVIFEKTFGGSNMERFNSAVVYRNNIIAVGSSNSDDSGLKIFTDGTKTAGILVKYDLNGNSENKMVLGGSNTDNITNVITDYSNLYVTSYTNSKDGNISTRSDNGKDYFGRLIKLDSRLHILFTK